MERYAEQREEAKKKIGIADHMLITTYPLVKDPKLLITILENVLQALEAGIGSVLEHELLYKQIPPFGKTVEGQFSMFRKEIVRKYSLNEKDIRMIMEIRELMHGHKQSAMEFVRKGSVVLSDDQYNVKKLDPVKVRDYIVRSKAFLEQLSALTTKNDTMYRRR
ncbi:hypothetical protein C4573_04420 [Candidatus Woesearchaeota archaeon]|nr:MAG: hypothetical protein C4573_04420 [Candidatus Woesearchaeota archaeon]